MMLWRGWSLWCGWGAWKHEGGGPAPPLPRSQTNNRTLQNFAEKRKILQNVGWRQMAAQPRSAHTIKRYTPFTFNESGFRLTGSRSDPRQKKKMNPNPFISKNPDPDQSFKKNQNPTKNLIRIQPEKNSPSDRTGSESKILMSTFCCCIHSCTAINHASRVLYNLTSSLRFVFCFCFFLSLDNQRTTCHDKD